MTQPANKPRILQRGKQKSQVLIETSLQRNFDRQETLVVPEHSVDSRWNRPLPLPPTSHKARTTMKTLREVEEKVATFGPEDYRNAYKNADPVSPDLTADTHEVFRNNITAFGDEIYAVFSAGNSASEELWTAYVYIFPSHSLKVWPKCLTYKWCQLLRSRGIHVDSGKKHSWADTLTLLLFRKVHIPARLIAQNEELSPDTQIGQAHEWIQEEQNKPIREGPTLVNIDEKDLPCNE